MFTSIIHILKLNELREGKSKSTGNEYRMQDAECLLLNADGSVSEVGVLMIPKDMLGSVQVGIFTASFALRASKARDAGRRIEAVLTGLVPVPPAAPAAPKAPAAAAPATPGAK